MPNFAYRGPLSSGFRMELTLSGSAVAGTVTGVVRSGTNLAAIVLGFYTAGTFLGTASYGASFSGVGFVQPIFGAFVGGGGPPAELDIAPFPLLFNNQLTMVAYTLTVPPAPPPVTTPPAVVGPPPLLNFHTATSFNYTVVDLTMKFQLAGPHYDVSGALNVRILNPVTGTVSHTSLAVSGTYHPGAGPTNFSLSGPVGPHDHPSFTGSIVPTNVFGGHLTGLESLGIHSLFFGVVAH